MSAETWMYRWVAWVWLALQTWGCAGAELSTPEPMHRHRSQRMAGTQLAMASPGGMAMRAVPGGAISVDAFESLLGLAGLEHWGEFPSRDEALSPEEAARLLAVLLRKPVTLANFPPRMAASHLLREVLQGEAVSRQELLRRVERFNRVAVLRPDGYLAWVVNGRTQQKAGPVDWKDGAFRAHGFELGRFYTIQRGVFRLADARMQPAGPMVAEVYDDEDYVSRTLDGAEEAFFELAMAMGKLLTYPADSLVALHQLPVGLAALLASSPEYLERLRFMTRGEQVKALSKLVTTLIVTCGAAGGTTSTLTAALGGAEAMVPVLSLTAEGALVLERVAVPVGSVATAVGTGVGGVYVLSTSGGANGSRAGKAFTPGGKRQIDAENAAKNGGVNQCEKCGVSVVPGQKSQRGVTPPGNQRERDHIIPKSQGGDGSPSNGQVLCRGCNLEKSDAGP